MSGPSTAGHIYGLNLSGNPVTPTTHVDFAAGNAASGGSTPYVMILASSLTKRIDVAWAAGTGNGGLDTGSVGSNLYYAWLIQRSDTGVCDALFSLSNTSPTMPASYDRKRLIGRVYRLLGSNSALFSEGIEARVGITQTWQEMTSSRAVNTICQNNTNVPISVSIQTDVVDAATRFSVSVNGSIWVDIGYSTRDETGGGSTYRMASSGPFLIPVGAYYRFSSLQAGLAGRSCANGPINAA